MMKTSTKLFATGAASLLGVALAAGGAHAATGALSAADAPGQVLKVRGVAPAAAHANDTARAHANANAKGEMAIHAATSRVQLWIMPTNEEIVVARQTQTLLGTTKAG